jgi:EAL domain-containing protein (putative c-di-GMP-specific phosphodiesterase class I)
VNLNVTMLAEGVETTDQFARLVGLGCKLAQGFLFSPAVPNEQASTMVGSNFHAQVGALNLADVTARTAKKLFDD